MKVDLLFTLGMICSNFIFSQTQELRKNIKEEK